MKMVAPDYSEVVDVPDTLVAHYQSLGAIPADSSRAGREAVFRAQIAQHPQQGPSEPGLEEQAGAFGITKRTAGALPAMAGMAGAPFGPIGGGIAAGGGELARQSVAEEPFNPWRVDTAAAEGAAFAGVPKALGAVNKVPGLSKMLLNVAKFTKLHPAAQALELLMNRGTVKATEQAVAKAAPLVFESGAPAGTQVLTAGAPKVAGAIVPAVEGGAPTVERAAAKAVAGERVPIEVPGKPAASRGIAQKGITGRQAAARAEGMAKVAETGPITAKNADAFLARFVKQAAGKTGAARTELQMDMEREMTERGLDVAQKKLMRRAFAASVSGG